MVSWKRTVFNLVAIVAIVVAAVGFVPVVNQQPQVDPVSAPAAPQVAKRAPIAIDALPRSGEHLRAPRDEVVIKWLQDRGAVPLNATQEQMKAALREFKAEFAKKSDTWVSPEIQAWALQRESELADTNRPQEALAIQPVTATVLAMAVDFGATETFTIPVQVGEEDDGTPICVTATTTITGPLNGLMQHPGPRDNNTTWYSPTLTTNAKFYEKLIFGYEGAGRVRLDLTDPRDGLPGINSAGNTVQDYYDHVAGDGNVYITGTVEGWVTVPHSEGYYGADNCASGGHGGGAGVPVAQVAVDAAKQFSMTHPSYYTDTSVSAFWPKYDGDGDGVIDTFWVVHAGAGQEAGGGVEGTFSIWSHSSDLRNYANWPDGFKVYEGDVMTTTDDIVMGPYTTQPENADLGVFVEEFGHNFFGWPDMYTTDYDNSIGFWNTMAGGVWGGYLGGSQPTGMPLWFRMIATCGYDYVNEEYIPCNWQEPMIIRDYDDATADVVIGQLEKTPAGVNKGVRVNLPPVVETVPNWAGAGKGAYTGAGRDQIDIRLTRQFTVSNVTTPTLMMDTYWKIEKDWDYGYVMVNGTILQDMDGVLVNTNPNGNNLGYGLTGAGEETLRFNLAAYKGQVVTLTLRYKTDANTTEAGWWVDNVMMDSTLIDDFAGATAPGTFAGWTNTAPTGWLVVPTTKSYTNYYLAEWRSTTKYDSATRTAYVTTFSDDDEWEVARIPYNIPGALVYYRNTKYGSTYSLAPNQYDPPSIGPKYQLLVVDMNPAPLRYGATAPYTSVLGTRAGSYDAALTVQPSDAFTLTQINAVPAPITGTFAYPSKPAVTQFNDAKGYTTGYYYGTPCAAGYVCWTNRWGSAVIPARGNYSTRITNYSGSPFYGLYGVKFSGSVLGSGNPGDDNVQHGVNIKLLSGNAVTATLRFNNYSVDFDTAYTPSVNKAVGTYTVTYQTIVSNAGVEAASNVSTTYALDPELTKVSFTASAGTIATDTLKWSTPTLAAGSVVTVTLVATGTTESTMVLETDMMAFDGQISRGPWFLLTDVVTYRLYLPIIVR